MEAGPFMFGCSQCCFQNVYVYLFRSKLVLFSANLATVLVLFSPFFNSLMDTFFSFAISFHVPML